MKKTFFKIATLLSLIAATTVSTAQFSYAESRLQRILAEGVLRVGTTGDFNPMSIKDVDSNDYKGFDIDLVTMLAKDMGVELEFVPTDWKTLVNGVLADKYDMTTSASVTPSRALVAGYTDPYINFGTIPMAMAENVNKYTSWAEIDQKGITVAVTLGTSFESQAEEYFKNATIKKVESPAREYQEVLAGRADVSLTSNVEAASLQKTYENLKVIETDAPLSSAAGAFLVAQDDQVWINFLNHWIRQAKSKGAIRSNYNKWFN